MAVSLHVRIELLDGRRVYRPPAFTKNNKLLAEYAMVGAIPEHHPEAVFAMRYTERGKRVWKAVGKDPNKALAAKLKREHLEHGREIGQLVSYDIEPIPATSKRFITATIESYLDDLSRTAKPGTLRVYRRALEFFAQAVAPTKHVEDLTREDVKRYLRAIHQLDVSNRTIANRLGYVQAFLSENGLVDATESARRQWCESLLTPKDKPKYTERDPNAYNPETLQHLFAAASPEDRVVFQLFLGSGAREQEVAYACWPDIDLVCGTFRVQEKKRHGLDAEGL
jgi:integrase